MNLTDKTGPLAAQLLVQPEEDIQLITDDGTIIRTSVNEIRVCGRNTQGVRLMRVAEGSQVVGVARAEAEEEEGMAVEEPQDTEENEE
jgi:DNA gyrase subunit A